MTAPSPIRSATTSATRSATPVATATAATKATKTGRRIVGFLNPRSISALINRNGPLDLLRWVAVALLVASLTRGWLQPALSAPIRATALSIELPLFGRHQLLSWGLVVGIAAVLGVVGWIPWGRRRPALTDLSALAALGATIGFLLQSCLADVGLQQALRRDAIDLADLQLVVGYRIPRPTVTTLGPIPLPTSVSDVLSALRSGFYLALLATVLLTVVAVRHRRSAGRRGRRGVQLVAVALVLAIAPSVVQNGLAARAISSAVNSAAAGDDSSAVAEYQAALNHRSGLSSNPDVLAQYGLSQLRRGPADDPAAQLATSRLQLQGGKDLAALQSVAAAGRRWPRDTALHHEFSAQAFTYLRRHRTPEPVRALISEENDSALLRITLARYELMTGDNPAAIVDAGIAEAIAADSDVRSVALTLLSVGQSRSGDQVQGRRTLLAAVDADHEYVNVMARSMLAGLYNTLPL